MASRLENLDKSILRIIAFFHFTSASLGTPQVLQLLMVSNTIRKALNLQACPGLYADVFYVYFDAALQRVLYPSLTVDRLAPELVHRLHVLRRVHILEFSEQHLQTDLWTVYLMVLEGGGRNEAQLAMAGISRFVFTLIRRRFGEEYTRYGRPLMNEINALALWLACLTTSPHTFANETRKGRDELYDLIRPFAIISANCRQDGFLASQNFSGRSAALSDLSFGIGTSDLSSQGVCEVLLYSERRRMSCPSISSASIFLAFLLKDISPLDAPSHLPETLQRKGLTLEDYALILESKTPNIADRPCQIPLHLDGLIYKDDFSRAVRNSPPGFFFQFQTRAHAPGVLTGVWEGQFMTSQPAISDCGPPYSDFISRHPIQFFLNEEFDSCPEGALPGNVVGINNIQHDEDAMITGESHGTYDQACGGFRYVGKVRLRDGLIVLKRESVQKSADPACHGSWIFEGYVHARCALIGRWYGATQSANDTRSEGVFCMSKRPDVLVRDTSWSSRL
ncbi:hypothetical protein PILCRDRAFT_812758 [Piloderma croceum F 1598]|uniref:Uncharacterized protein n=1 Tax=Piloderma croceum (strain F 1598) TaxID=765440 RepID=A0A0C3GH61_PILCF|nr:hypothetical protein PILCRDRAFT_812758 [Piloderma croceum F 1598]